MIWGKSPHNPTEFETRNTIVSAGRSEHEEWGQRTLMQSFGALGWPRNKLRALFVDALLESTSSAAVSSVRIITRRCCTAASTCRRRRRGEEAAPDLIVGLIQSTPGALRSPYLSASPLLISTPYRGQRQAGNSLRNQTKRRGNQMPRLWLTPQGAGHY